MEPLGRPQLQRLWCRHLPGLLLLQLCLAVCLFSYMRVVRESPSTFTALDPDTISPNASSRRPLVVLLWSWPFNRPVKLVRCSTLRPSADDCELTANRSVYQRADAVIVHHREVSAQPQRQLPPSPRPAGQRWVWFSLESPSNCRHLQALDGYFNLTMSYRSDSDIFTPYGWLEPWPDAPTAAEQVNLSAKTELVAWAVSNWQPKSARVKYYQELRAHLPVHVFGAGHQSLPQASMMETLSRYKFYLAFENSQHPDYITEKLWKNALLAGAVPVVLGPSRSSYERFLPPDAFIHVDDFGSPKELAQHLQALDRDPARYLSYFRWREMLRPGLGSWALYFCKACWHLQQETRYQAVPSIAAWFT
ncbi:4-galactosyl-N-acetylglucosaminide 3-alpha-L-fucosyltransferase FUT5-like [Ochotona princeps]|uniref:4-galactosyl-N-acetylglucosaminide 3-alpha-L-fucosyltransferase FUT5-like n=1 Tax=Ochotona princeps TaxID=9978 RepID=UPI0027153C8A|nr:4-galactosyl-N-acetylglucosaminide 3-alpha-L-fucosyltransferase FUT5-like [Ochotona princeps]